MRKIRFKLLTQIQLETIESNARTFGELKQEVLNSEISDKIKFDGVQFIERETKAAYGAIADAILPQTDLLFYVQPLETKSGVDFENMSYTDLYKLCSKLNRENNAGIKFNHLTKSEIIRNIENYYRMVDVKNNKASKSVVVSKLDSVIAQLIEISQILQESTLGEDYAIAVTLDELEKESQQLHKEITGK